MNDTEKLYKYIYRISEMGMGATATILCVYDKTALSMELAAQNNEYRMIFIDAKKALLNRNNCLCKLGLSLREKLTSCLMIKCNLLKDKTDSRIAQMIINGCTRGIIEGIKAKKRCSSADDASLTLLGKLIDYQTGTSERMKEFL